MRKADLGENSRWVLRLDNRWTCLTSVGQCTFGSGAITQCTLTASIVTCDKRCDGRLPHQARPPLQSADAGPRLPVWLLDCLDFTVHTRLQTWRKRWFVLESGKFSYYEDEGGKLKGSVRCAFAFECLI